MRWELLGGRRPNATVIAAVTLVDQRPAEA
jgi:hypothetical protein